MKQPFSRPLTLLAIALPLALLAACTGMFFSDAQYSAKQSAEARERARRSMEISSSQAAAAEAVAGEALVGLLSGKSHISEYRKRAKDAQPYFTSYDYYAPDGSFLRRDTHARRAEGYQEVGTWTVDGDTLCISIPSRGPAPDCYTLRLAPDGTIQYWIRKSGDEFDGLLTRNVTIVREGPQAPEYTSDPADFR
jgi:hypothetical protein